MVEIILPDKTDPARKEVYEGLFFQWIMQGDAYVIVLASPSAATIDQYIAWNIAVLNQWKPPQPFFSIQDISHPTITVTPYLRHKLETVSQAIHTSGVTGHSMIILPKGIMGTAMQLFGFIFARKSQPVQQHWCSTYAQAEKTLHQLKRTV